MDLEKTIIPDTTDDLPLFVTLVGEAWSIALDNSDHCMIFPDPGPPPPLRLHRVGLVDYTEEIAYAGGIWEFSLIRNPDLTYTMVLSTEFGLFTVLSTPGGGPLPYGIYSFGDGCNQPQDYTITP